MAEEQIELIGRTLIVSNDRFVVCRVRGKKWCFLPGGHVDFGEPVELGIRRELVEELGIKAENLHFVGALEHFYDQDNHRKHEINLVFATEIPNPQLVSKESHIEFEALPISQLSEVNLLPAALKPMLEQWLAKKAVSWVGGTK